MQSEENAPPPLSVKNGDPTFGFSLTTMLQHTGRFLVKDFLGKNSVTTLQHLKYSLDQAPGEFYISLGIKSTLKGRRFCDSIDVIKNATKELKRLSQ